MRTLDELRVLIFFGFLVTGAGITKPSLKQKNLFKRTFFETLAAISLDGS
jgi:hypothetical protein